MRKSEFSLGQTFSDEGEAQDYASEHFGKPRHSYEQGGAILKGPLREGEEPFYGVYRKRK